MTHITCRLTAKNRDQLWNPTLGNRVWATFTFFTLQVNLLDSKRSLNVNIILHQFRATPTELVESLRRALPRGCSSRAATVSASPGSATVELSVERLRGLRRVLPESDDVDALRTFEGDVGRLGTAEKFYLQLIQLPQ